MVVTAGSEPLSGDPPGEYFVAWLDGHAAAGIAPLPGGVEPPPAAWYTHVAVDDLSIATARALRRGADVLLDDWDATPAGRLSVLGWQADPFDAGDGPPFWLFRLPGYVGGEPSQPVSRDVVAAMTTTDGTQERWDVDFWVADAQAAAVVAPGLGGTVLPEPVQSGGFMRTVLADPRGAPFPASQLLMAG